MDRSTSSIRTLGTLLLPGLAFCVLSACEPGSEVAQDAPTDIASSTDRLGKRNEGETSGEVVVPACPNDLECLVVRNGASIGGWTATEGLQVGSSGLFVSPPLALCGEIPCETSMWWQYDGDNDRLFLHSARRNSTNPQPVLVIERQMSEDNPARIGIGVSADHDITHELEVNGTILASEIIVETGWADYVFDDDYPLMSLDEVARLIDEQGHLPGLPPAHEMTGRGVSLGDMQVLLLEKIEEMTLHLIAQKREIKRLHKRIKLIEETPR